ncbi:MAG: 16S rRNA (cytosine(1402)-N(4))-methyltransferase [SAR116 cluster bacterium]|nr:16S rRNA (cytosine(1402)-N(4))-methyltransferase [SAR116 cluster bacterium]RPG92047.1 MAG: 16S rRNA (cytosine(1402)-N(4))-methyltransferase RsmH [Candidatus Puniceispirillum sp. TMED213]|tara:strand:+ start:480 stop:1469 length:990 start_codon:yes stop_codon:yes gene_type:complete
MSGAQKTRYVGLHTPVMLDEVSAALRPEAGKMLIDATFGNGGYSMHFLNIADCHVAALDRDPDAIARGQAIVQAFSGRLSLYEGSFSAIRQMVAGSNFEQVDGIVFDLGVCSTQLDQAERGFSFRLDGPLDMRMTPAGESAGDVINSYKEEQIADILWRYGEERFSRRIARAIVKARTDSPIARTGQLAEIIHSVMPRPKPGKPDSATRTFQALRIHVNQELDELEHALAACVYLLKPGGILAVVSFHSLEDRIVKQFMAGMSGLRGRPSRHRPDQETHSPPLFALVTRKPVLPSSAEELANPRARSAKLRVARRTDTPATPLPNRGFS